MKTWLKSFFKGMWMACYILIAIGVAAVVFRGLVKGLLWVVAWFERTAPTPSTIIALISVCFVVAFGMIYSFW